MALRICRKINSGVPRICTRLLSSNVPQLAVFKSPEESIPTCGKEKESGEVASLVRSSISSNQRTTPVENPRQWSDAFETEHDSEQRGIENKFLQPATMPGYSEKPIFDHKFMESIQDPQIKKAQDISLNNSASQNILEVLKKKQNKSSYIKFVKMASSPFPDPIKAIFSPYTISDEEKARQMFDDHKMARMMSTQLEKGRVSPGHRGNDKFIRASKKFHGAVPSEDFRGLEQTQKRFYGTGMFKTLHFDHLGNFYSVSGNSLNEHRFFSDKKGCEKSEVCIDKKKCPKEKSCIPKKCDKIKIKGCPAVRGDGICKERIQEVKCTKIEAPYPSFSEKCYLEPKPRNSECDICPWSRKRNPNFKSKIKLPNRDFHTNLFAKTAGQNLTKSLEGLSSQCNNIHTTSVWMQTANFSQIHRNGKKIPKVDFYDFGKLGKIVSHLFKDDDCGKVGKDSNKCKKISPGPCKGAKLRKPIDYLKEHFEKNKGKKGGNCDTGEQSKCSSNYGYCLRRPTVMTEFLTQNSELMTNFRNGDDLGDFGVDKAKLSRLLCNPGLAEIIFKTDQKGTEYPENCEKLYQDTTKKCPTGLTYKKTNKDRLKRKKPKETEPVCEKK